MTNEEAHNWLENKQRLMTGNRWYFGSIDLEVNGKAIEAIEKQIPLKPDIKIADGRKIYYCNVCGCSLCDDDGSEYCSFCGQKIDWSEDMTDNR